MTCPCCGDDAVKVIYAGFPGRFCTAESCSTMWGPASWAALVLFNGFLMVYEGSYWTALWHWLTREST